VCTTGTGIPVGGAYFEQTTINLMCGNSISAQYYRAFVFLFFYRTPIISKHFLLAQLSMLDVRV
ncbi:MAG: hypothetical protein IJM88_04190, partial [Bacteroidales bacterium]|nr:hypothetical protein [Bacteroidales bacterium]